MNISPACRCHDCITIDSFKPVPLTRADYKFLRPITSRWLKLQKWIPIAYKYRHILPRGLHYQLLAESAEIEDNLRTVFPQLYVTN